VKRRQKLWALGILPAAALGQCAPQCTPGPAPAVSSWTVNWDKVAICESGGRWDYPPVRNSAGVFSGGLMWNHRYWLAAGGGEFAQYPYQATKAEQILVSERFIQGSYSKAAVSDP
jgi:hypothetical protein